MEAWDPGREEGSLSFRGPVLKARAGCLPHSRAQLLLIPGPLWGGYGRPVPTMAWPPGASCSLTCPKMGRCWD